MAKLSYWEKRRAQMMYEQMEIAESASSAVGFEYLKAARYIDKQIKENYSKIANDFKIADKEMLKLMQEGDIDSYEKLIKYVNRKGFPEEVIEYLNKPGQKYKFEKLLNTRKNIDNALNVLAGKQSDITTDALKLVSQNTYYKSIYEIQKHIGLGFSFNEWDDKLFTKVINSKWSGENYSARIWNNRDKLAETVKSEIIQGFITGKTQNEMYDVIVNKFATKAIDAKRLIRTESCYAANEMEMQSYAECDIEKYVFVATLDLRTSEMCASLDGKVFDVKNAMPGENMPPMHPWCRSTTIEYIDDETLKHIKRRARDPVTGKNITVPADISYKDWYDKYVANQDLNKILDSMNAKEQKKFCGGNQRWALVKAGIIKNPAELRIMKSKSLNQLKEDGIILLDSRGLNHSTKGEFTKLKNPKLPASAKNGGNMKGGGHSQKNIEELENRGIIYNIEHIYPNGVRVGGVENHKSNEKRLGNNGQSWFPENWTDDDILVAGTYVANNPAIYHDVEGKKGDITGILIFQEYKGVTIGTFVDSKNNIETVFPDGSQRKVSD